VFGSSRGIVVDDSANVDIRILRDDHNHDTPHRGQVGG
jgi:hypothetical protein